MKRSMALAGALLSIALLAGCDDETGDKKSQAQSIKLLTWSDFHGAFYESVKDGVATGGLPVFMSAVNQLRGDGDNTIIIDAGDMYQGHVPVNQSKGRAMIDVMNALKLDVTTLGNHEFDYGVGTTDTSSRGALLENIALSQFEYVNANIQQSEGATEVWPPEGIKPFTIIEKGGYKIAVIGLLAANALSQIAVDNVKGIETIPVSQALTKVMPQVVAQDPDFVVVAAHIDGLPVPKPADGAVLTDAPFDVEINEILTMDESVRKHIDLIIAGHSHENFLAYQGDITVVQSPNAGRIITEMTLVPDGKGDLKIDRASVKKHELTHEPLDAKCGEAPKAFTEIPVGDLTLTPSEEARAIVNKYEALSTGNRCEVVSCTTESLVRQPYGQCPVGNLVTQAMLWYYNEVLNKDVAIALQSGGSQRSDLPEGTLYRENIQALLPFGNTTMLVEMPASALESILKVSASENYRTIKTAGLRYSYMDPALCDYLGDANGDGEEDSWEKYCLCQPFQYAEHYDDTPDLFTESNAPTTAPKETYTVVINDFTYGDGVNGGDGLTGVMKDVHVLYRDTKKMDEILIDYLKAKHPFGTDTCFGVADYSSADAEGMLIHRMGEGETCDYLQ